MALEKFTWNNGTATSPIVLNNQQIAALSAAGNNENIETHIGGYITTQSRKMQKFLKYSLEESFPDLHVVVDEELADTFTIGITNPTVLEGSSVPIILSGDAVNNGLSHEYLKWDIQFAEPNITYGDINKEIIQSRISVENGMLVVGDPRENASWSVDVRLTAYPLYETGSVENMQSKSNELRLTVRAEAITGFTAVVDDEIATNSDIIITSIPTPTTSTKLKGSSYEFTTSDTDKVYCSGNYARTLGVTGTASITVGLKLFGNNIPIYYNKVKFSVYDLMPTAFIIDQRALNGRTDPASIVSSNFKVGTNGDLTLLSANGAQGTAQSNTITWLRQNSHLYVGKYNPYAIGEASMKLKQLDDKDATKFADGTDASAYIQNASNTNNISYDVWMKLPCDVYYKSEAWMPEGASEKDDNYVLITISKDKPEDMTGWNVWNGNKLIGAYKASQDANNRLHSLSGKIPVNSITQTNSRNRGRNRGDGFKLVDYETQTIMAILFYGYYGTTNAQEQCGYGTANGITVGTNTSYYPKLTGLTNSLGMQDTTGLIEDADKANYGNGAATPDEEQIKTGTGADIRSVKFWGLENWWGDTHEWMDDMMVMQARRPANVTTANSDNYLDDYIAKYLGANPSQSGVKVTINGIDTLITPEDISESAGLYAEDDRFISIKDINNNMLRIIKSNIKNSSGYIGKMMFGQHCDTFPKALGGGEKSMFSDFACVDSPGDVARRSYYSVSPSGGVAYLHLYYSVNSPHSFVSSRLLYEGTESRIHIVEENENF